MKLVFALYIILVSVKANCQKNEAPFKFEVERTYIKDFNDSTKSKLREGHHIIVLDIKKAKVSVYPDSLIIDIISTIDTKQMNDSIMSSSFSGIDQYGRKCKGMFVMFNMKFEQFIYMLPNRHIYYFIKEAIRYKD